MDPNLHTLPQFGKHSVQTFSATEFSDLCYILWTQVLFAACYEMYIPSSNPNTKITNVKGDKNSRVFKKHLNVQNSLWSIPQNQ